MRMAIRYMAKKEAEEPRGENFLVRWKKPLRALSLVIALGGSLILMIFTFLIHDALDKTEKAITTNIENIQESLVDVEDSLAGVEAELDSANQTITQLEGSLEPLSDGLESAADALSEISGSLSLINIPTLGISIDTGELDEAADSLSDASANLGATDLGEHEENLFDLKGSVGRIRDGIASQRLELEETKKTIQDVMGLMKIANVLFFLVVVSMFFMLSLNSVAGLL